MIKLLIGGSPCTYWSIAQKNNRETVAEGIGWELFKNYLIALEKFQPDFFLYENNKSASSVIKEQIFREFGVSCKGSFARYIEINSSLVSAQNRQRFYVHNCGNVQQPVDRGILFRDIVEDGGYPLCETVDGKSFALTTRCCNAIPVDTLKRRRHSMVAVPYSGDGIKPIYQVVDGKISINGVIFSVNLADGFYIIRKMSVKECCRLQTMPDDYCSAVSDSQAFKCLGNGWTADVIIHILSGALKDVPRDEKLFVLSMYDGIATGRYCLDKMGFKNVEYHAYEIDKHAIKVALSNYPDIIYHGDAFSIRDKFIFI